MSDDPTLDPTVAITFPGQPLIFAVPVLVILTMVAIVVIQKSRHRTAAAAAWASASNELGIQFVGDGSKLGPVARGQVKSHVVSDNPGAQRRQEADRDPIQRQVRSTRGPEVQTRQTHER